MLVKIPQSSQQDMYVNPDRVAFIQEVPSRMSIRAADTKEEMKTMIWFSGREFSQDNGDYIVSTLPLERVAFLLGVRS